MVVSRSNRNATGAEAPRSLEPALVPLQVPARTLRWTGWLLIALFTAVSLVAFLVPFPETLRLPFLLVSEQGTDPIQSPLFAIVHAVQVSEGQEVEEGAELIVLRADEIRGWQLQLQNLREDLSATHQRTNRLEELHLASLRIKDEEARQVERDLAFRRQHLATTRDFLARNQKLAAAHLLSEVELVRHELEVAEVEKDLNVAERLLHQVALERQRLETSRARERTEETSEIEKLNARVAMLRRQLEHCTGDRLSVRAPYPAVVLALAHRNPGTVVQAGAELCQLARRDGQPLARLTVSQAGVPRLSRGQPVRFFFEAFPYQRHGTLTGRLNWISPAPITSGEPPMFVARATLDSASFATREGERPVRIGMKGEAKVTVDRRTIAELAWEPLRRLRETTRP